ncbi:hypothetical protein GJ496_007293 [Pomphorhynchus laevis]|nr:hypothetical protein GJ496_007293 [Pomphorhynchus laevis]
MKAVYFPNLANLMPFNRRRGYGNRFRTRMEREVADNIGTLHRSGGVCRSTFQSRNALNREQWFRVLLLSSHGVSKSIISTTINDYSKKPIQLLNYQNDTRNGRVVFYVHSREEADEIRSLGKTIILQNKPATIIVHRVDDPVYQLDEENSLVLKEFLKRRYVPNLEMLDLSHFAENSDLLAMGIYVNFRRTQSYDQFMQMAEDIFPDITALDLSSNGLISLEFLRNRFKNLKRLNLSSNQIHRLRELDFLKHLKLIEIDIQNNPLATQFSSIEDFSSLVREKQTRLAIINGVELPPLIGFAVDDEPLTLPESLYHFIPADLKDGITHFIKLYFEMFDSNNRQSLINAYHENAVLSLSINSQRAFRFERYAKEGRNFLKINDEASRYERLKRGSCDIISLFVRLPRTRHSLKSFKVDVFFRKNNSFSLSVFGLYKEDVSVATAPYTKDHGLVRSFCRIFHCIIESGGMIIVSEHLHIRDGSEQQSKSIYNGEMKEDQQSTDLNKSVSDKNSLIESLMKATGMNRTYSEQCLSGNKWDFNKSCTDFLELKSKNMIPKEAFLVNERF